MQSEHSKSWIQRLKDESWEAELLVSIASIVAIFNGFGLLEWLVDFFIENLNPTQYFIGYMVVVFGYLGFGILGAFFIIHFGLRSYWIGLIGLNSVFPDYRKEENKYSPIYNDKMLRLLPKVPETITTLDEICSIIFAAAFALLICYAYTSAVGATLLFLHSFLSDYIPLNFFLILGGILALIVLVFTAVYIVATRKKNHDNEKIQHWFYQTIVWQYKVLYGPFYKYLLQTITMFTSNSKQKPATISALKIMIVLGIVFATLQLRQSNYLYLTRVDLPQDEARIYPEHYASNKVGKTILIAPEIQSQMVSDKVLSLFVPMLKNETTRLAKACDLDDIDNQDDQNNQAKQTQWRELAVCYADSVEVRLGETEKVIEFTKMEHPTTGQFGLFAFIGLDGLLNGEYRLSVVKSIEKEQAKTWHIPFYYAAK